MRFSHLFEASSMENRQRNFWLNRYISEARRSIEMARLLDIGKYTIETLVFLCVMVMLLLQFRIW